MRKDHAKYRVALVLTPGAPLYEIGVPMEVFGDPRPELMDPPYELMLVAADPQVTVEAGFRLASVGDLSLLKGAGTVIVPAVESIATGNSPDLLDALQQAHAAGARIVSLCSGAFVLAEAGLLSGRRATTHWMYAQDLARRHPDIMVDPAVLYTADGNIFTSAGTAAAMDLCLELVRRDRGTGVVNELARRLVVTPHRAADQAQFVRLPVPEPREGSSLSELTDWMLGNLHQPLALADLATRAHLSVRTLVRRFKEEQGLAPGAWLARERIRHAQQLLESTTLTVEAVAARCGYGTATSFRQAFARQLHTTPQAYRQGFGAQSSRGPAISAGTQPAT